MAGWLGVRAWVDSYDVHVTGHTASVLDPWITTTLNW